MKITHVQHEGLRYSSSPGDCNKSKQFGRKKMLLRVGYSTTQNMLVTNRRQLCQLVCSKVPQTPQKLVQQMVSMRNGVSLALYAAQMATPRRKRCLPGQVSFLTLQFATNSATMRRLSITPMGNQRKIQKTQSARCSEKQPQILNKMTRNTCMLANNRTIRTNKPASCQQVCSNFSLTQNRRSLLESRVMDRLNTQTAQIVDEVRQQ